MFGIDLIWFTRNTFLYRKLKKTVRATERFS